MIFSDYGGAEGETCRKWRCK